VKAASTRSTVGGQQRASTPPNGFITRVIRGKKEQLSCFFQQKKLVFMKKKGNFA